MAKPEERPMIVHRTVKPHHCFHWDTRLSDERMEEIEAFLASLTDEQMKMIEDIRADCREAAEYDFLGD